VYLVRGRAAFMKHGAFAVLGWIFPIAALMVAPLGAGELLRSAHGYSGRTWAAIAYVVLAPTVLAYGGNAFALARAPSSLVAAFIYVQPALAVLLAVTIGDPLARWLGVRPPNERLDASMAVGLVAILGGVWIATRPRVEGAKA
jgi:drug/metabolite transporter (DMT)-like permease